MDFTTLEILFLERGISTLPGRSSPGARVDQFLSLSLTTCGRLQKWPQIIPLSLSSSFGSAALCWLWPWDQLQPMELTQMWHSRGLKWTRIVRLCILFYFITVFGPLRSPCKWAHANCYGMNCVPHPKFTCWNLNLQYLRIWLYLEMGV